MKPCVVNTIRSARPRPPRECPPSIRTLLPLSRRAALLCGGAAIALTLSGCYYPAGYYPGGYYTSYYATPSTATAQQGAPDDPSNPPSAQQAQPQTAPPNSPPGYAVAAPPPVYVEPYPAYYPPPVYPYPAYYGPSIAIGVGGYWGGGWGRHWH